MNKKPAYLRSICAESAEVTLEQAIEVGPQSVEVEVLEPSVDVEIEPVPEKVLELENSPDVIPAVGIKLTATSTLDSPDIGEWWDLHTGVKNRTDHFSWFSHFVPHLCEYLFRR